MRTPNSRSTLVLLLSLPLAIPLSACAPADDAADGADAPDTAADATAPADAGWLDDLVASYEQHFNANHADSIAALYTEDAVVLGADGTVANGRDEIRAWSAANQAGGSLDIELIDRMAFGDQAVAIGSWEITPVAEEGDAAPVGGHWMGAYRATPDGWRSMGLISNYAQEMPAEALQGTLPSNPPPDESTIDELLTAYEAAWNEGNAQAVANLYAEDAWAALINLPAIRGRAAIADVMTERIAGTTIELQGARTVEFGGGWSGDGGLVRIRRDDGEEIVGHYWVLLHRNEDGSQSIKWALSNGRPASVIPSGDGM